MKSRKLLDIIIVNWNTGNLLTECVESIYQSDLPADDFRILVVDNASSDQSLELLEEQDNLLCIKNPSNLGFGAACNQGIKKSNSDYILLLNPDMRVYTDTLSRSIHRIEQLGKVDVLGIQLLNSKNDIARTCSRFPTLIRFLWEVLSLSKFIPSIFTPPTIMRDWDHKNSCEVDHVIGAYMLIRATILNKVGVFDENFFMYLEDLDLSRRIKASGGSIYYASDIKAYHEGGGASKKVKAKRLAYSLRSRLHYSKKYFSRMQHLILLLLTLIIEPFTRLIPLIFTLRIKETRNTCVAYYYLCKSLILNITP